MYRSSVSRILLANIRRKKQTALYSQKKNEKCIPPCKPFGEASNFPTPKDKCEERKLMKCIRAFREDCFGLRTKCSYTKLYPLADFNKRCLTGCPLPRPKRRCEVQEEIEERKRIEDLKIIQARCVEDCKEKSIKKEPPKPKKKRKILK